MSTSSLGDKVLMVSALLLAVAVAAWAVRVWYGRWTEAETAFEHRGVTP